MNKLKWDRTTTLGIAAALLILSLFTANTIILIIALALFVMLVFYNMKKNISEDRLFDINKVSRGKQILLGVVQVVGVFGIAMGFLALFLSI